MEQMENEKRYCREMDMIFKKTVWAGFFVFVGVLAMIQASSAEAADLKIGVMNVQKVLAESTIGKKAKAKV